MPCRNTSWPPTGKFHGDDTPVPVLAHGKGHT
jgi:hypothetical protein